MVCLLRPLSILRALRSCGSQGTPSNKPLRADVVLAYARNHAAETATLGSRRRLL
jgi:hypothetical protein